MLEAQSEYTFRTPGGAILVNGAQATHLAALTAMAPAAWYHMGEVSGTTMVDATAGGAHPGTYINGPNVNWTSNLLELGGKATRFDGVNDYATIPYSAALDPPVPAADPLEWTWHLWIVPENLAAAGGILKTLLRDDAQAYVHVYIKSQRIYAQLVFAGETTLLDGGEIFEDLSYQVALAVSGNLVTLYRDGEIAAETVRATPVIQRTTGAWEFARGASGTNYFNGRIEDAAFFNRYLTLAEITRLNSIVLDPQLATFYMTDSPEVDVPVRTTMDVYPLADGGLIADEQYADPARWGLSGAMLAANASALQLDAQRWRGRLNSLKHGDGLIMWQPSGYPALQTTIRRGEKPNAGRGNGSSKPLIADLIAADPRVYSQIKVATSVTPADLDGGFTSPFVGPLVESAPATANAASVVNDGDEYTPPIIILDGPFTRTILTRQHTYNGITTVQQMILESSIEGGVALTIDVARGRIYTGTSYSAGSNRYDDLQDGSILWQLGPGINLVTCQMTGAGSGTSCTITHRHAWLP